MIQTTTSEGYGGNIVLYVGIRLDGTVNDISILSISETPGLGMKAGDVLVPQFHNKNVKSFAYTKTDPLLTVRSMPSAVRPSPRKQ